LQQIYKLVTQVSSTEVGSTVCRVVEDQVGVIIYCDNNW